MFRWHLTSREKKIFFKLFKKLPIFYIFKTLLVRREKFFIKSLHFGLINGTYILEKKKFYNFFLKMQHFRVQFGMDILEG